jgi:hypothetical protein
MAFVLPTAWAVTRSGRLSARPASTDLVGLSYLRYVPLAANSSVFLRYFMPFSFSVSLRFLFM